MVSSFEHATSCFDEKCFQPPTLSGGGGGGGGGGVEGGGGRVN